MRSWPTVEPWLQRIKWSSLRRRQDMHMDLTTRVPLQDLYRALFIGCMPGSHP
jgi:hypothetical protein